MKRTLLLLGILLPLFGWGQTVKIGDILCVQGTDTITVHPINYNGGAIGVVFYVDETGHHGWVLHPDIQAEGIQWSYECDLPWGLTGWQSIREAKATTTQDSCVLHRRTTTPDIQAHGRSTMSMVGIGLQSGNSTSYTAAPPSSTIPSSCLKVHKYKANGITGLHQYTASTTTVPFISDTTAEWEPSRNPGCIWEKSLCASAASETFKIDKP